MIGSTAMGSLSPGMSSAPVEAASPATTPSAQAASTAHDASVQETSTEGTAPSQVSTRNTPSQDDQPSEFDRLLDAPATGDAAEKSAPPANASTPSVDRAATAPKADRPDPSLAEQLLGLLGLLTPAATTQSAANAGTPPPTTAATPATPQLPATMGSASATPAPPAQAARQPSALLAGGTLAMPATGADPSPLAAAIDPKQTAAFSAQMAGVAATLVADQTPVRADGAAALIADATTLTPVVNLATTPAVATAAPLVSAPVPLLQPANAGAGYGDELGTSVVWLAEQRVGHAQLQVTPDHLGPIEVRLQLDGARVHAEFYSAQPEVRHALEASLPRLRDLLGQHGLQLGQADVGQRQHNGRHAPPMAGQPDTDCFPDGSSRPLPVTAHRVRGLLDEYA
jgi:flagellar hook-length control protein FliK